MIDMHTQKTHNNSLHLLDKTQPREERNPAGVSTQIRTKHTTVQDHLTDWKSLLAGQTL